MSRDFRETVSTVPGLGLCYFDFSQTDSDNANFFLLTVIIESCGHKNSPQVTGVTDTAKQFTAGGKTMLMGRKNKGKKQATIRCI
jgi:hypothetical protein